MSEIVMEIIVSLYDKAVDNITSIMVFMSVFLGLRYVLVTFGFDMFSLVLAILLFIWSFMIDLKRSKLKQMRKRGD